MNSEFDCDQFSNLHMIFLLIRKNLLIRYFFYHGKYLVINNKLIKTDAEKEDGVVINILFQPCVSKCEKYSFSEL